MCTQGERASSGINGMTCLIKGREELENTINRPTVIFQDGKKSTEIVMKTNGVSQEGERLCLIDLEKKKIRNRK